MHVEQVVRFGKSFRCQQRLQFLSYQTLELRTRVEVVDNPTVGADEVVMMVAGQRFGDLETVGAIGTANSYGNSRITEFGKVSIRGR